MGLNEKFFKSAAGSSIDPRDYFQPLVYSGNGNSSSGGKQVTGVGFEPDMFWIKNRTINGEHSAILDVLRNNRGNILYPDLSNTEADFGSSPGFTGTSDGFNINSGNLNVSGTNNYISWNWKAGGNSNTFNVDGTGYSSASAAGLSDGNTSLTGASVSTVSGFSVVTFNSGSTGNKTVPHGLGVKPSFVLFKKRNSEGGAWFTWSKGFSQENYYLYLQQNFDFGDLTQSANAWGNRSFDSDVVSFRAGFTVEPNRNIVLYSFADIPGYQKSSSYQGTGNAFTVFTTDDGSSGGANGFRPSFVLIKRTDSVGDWVIIDEPRGQGSIRLYANTAGKEDAGQGESFASNGFNPRTSTTRDTNTNGGTYIYLAIA